MLPAVMHPPTSHVVPDLQHLQDRIDALEAERARLLGLVGILREVSGALHYQDIVQTAAQRLGHLFGLDRCSVLLVTRGEGGAVHLVASYEDPTIRNLPIDLHKWPELRRAIQTGQVVHLTDPLSDPALGQAAPHLAARRVKTITVVPMTWQGHVIGALFLRTYQDGPSFSADDLEFCRVVAEITARSLRLIHRLERLQARHTAPGTLAADRGRAALLVFTHRLLGAWLERGRSGDLLARVADPEIDRLVEVALSALHREAGDG
jgi:GAF domain-containing protein